MNDTPKIDEIYKAVSDANYEYIHKNGPKSRPDIAIYMDIDYWHEVNSEIAGGVNLEAYEFYQNKTVRGYPVFQVVESPFNLHAPWRVVILN